MLFRRHIYEYSSRSKREKKYNCMLRARVEKLIKPNSRALVASLHRIVSLIPPSLFTAHPLTFEENDSWTKNQIRWTIVIFTHPASASLIDASRSIRKFVKNVKKYRRDRVHLDCSSYISENAEIENRFRDFHKFYLFVALLSLSLSLLAYAIYIYIHLSRSLYQSPVTLHYLHIINRITGQPLRANWNYVYHDGNKTISRIST